MTVDDWSEGRDGGQMLEMRPNCENCDCDLPPEDTTPSLLGISIDPGVLHRSWCVVSDPMR